MQHTVSPAEKFPSSGTEEAIPVQTGLAGAGDAAEWEWGEVALTGA